MEKAVVIWKRLVPVGLMIFVFLIFSNIANYTYLNGWQPVAPKWVIILSFLLLLPAVIESAKQDGLKPLLPVAIYVAVSGAIYFVSLLIFNTTTNQVLFRAQVVELLFFFICCLVFLGEKNQMIASYSILACLGLDIVINLIEVIFPSFFVAIGGRSAGFYGNPNISGLALVLGWVLVQEIIPNRYKTTATILIGAGVISTLSRTAIAIYLIIFTILLFRGSLLRYGLENWKVNLMLIATLSAYFFFGYHYNPQFKFAVGSQTGGIIRNFTEAKSDPGEMQAHGKNYTSLPAIQVVTNTLKEQSEIESIHSTPPTKIEEDIQETLKNHYSDDSLSARAFLWANAQKILKQNPIWGIGMDKAWAMNPHNMYMLLGLAYGVLGLLIFPVFCLLIALFGKTYKSKLVSLVLLLAGAFSHNLLVDRTVLLPAALAIMMTFEIRFVSVK